MSIRSSVLFGPSSSYRSPFELLHHVKGTPAFRHYVKTKINKNTGEVKKRDIFDPNKASRDLHHLFLKGLQHALVKMGGAADMLRSLPSSTAFKKGSWHIKNAEKHLAGEYYYITDLKDAYTNVDLKLLATLLVYIFRFEAYREEASCRAILASERFHKELLLDPLYQEMLDFLEIYFSGRHGRGLVFGGIASPFLFNLFMEAFLDSELRPMIAKRDRDAKITYTRFADDLVFSSPKLISSELRKEIRRKVTKINMKVNHRKSKVLARSMGTVFVTKVGIHREEDKLVFSGEKRAALHNMLNRYLQGKEEVEKVGGHMSEFIGYMKRVGSPTKSDIKLFLLCKEFERKEGNRRREKREQSR